MWGPNTIAQLFVGKRPPLRKPILDLAEKFQSCGGWGLERAFVEWSLKQPWRRCLPEVFQLLAHMFWANLTPTAFKQATKTSNLMRLVARLEVPREAQPNVFCWGACGFLQYFSEVKRNPCGDANVKIGLLLPHEILASLYAFNSGELFYAFLCGTPEAQRPS